jgi:hypothetical protein
MKPEYSSLGNIPSSVVSYQSLYLHYQSLYLHYQSLYLLESLPIPLFETEGRRELATHDWRTTGRVVYYESIKRELQSSRSKKKQNLFFKTFCNDTRAGALPLKLRVGWDEKIFADDWGAAIWCKAYLPSLPFSIHFRVLTETLHKPRNEVC